MTQHSWFQALNCLSHQRKRPTSPYHCCASYSRCSTCISWPDHMATILNLTSSFCLFSSFLHLCLLLVRCYLFRMLVLCRGYRTRKVRTGELTGRSPCPLSLLVLFFFRCCVFLTVLSMFLLCFTAVGCFMSRIISFDC